MWNDQVLPSLTERERRRLFFGSFYLELNAVVTYLAWARVKNHWRTEQFQAIANFAGRIYNESLAKMYKHVFYWKKYDEYRCFIVYVRISLLTTPVRYLLSVTVSTRVFTPDLFTSDSCDQLG